VQNALSSGNNVQMIGFGTFAVEERPARVGRNPATGKEIKIPAKKVVKFKVGKQLKDSVAGVKAKGKKK
jgi:DNA-binding protein HU-beta